MATIKLFAGTDVGLRDNNEDNFTVCKDLSLDEWMIPANPQESILLGKRGCLMVVADGMGGMNAGEVASDIAIKTVEQMFSPAQLPADVLEKPEAIETFIKRVIVCADKNIKAHCKEDPSTEGMGSTIVIAWLVGSTIYIGWLGDSRAYSYIPGKGISRLSKDHSYVQELVDAKMLTEEEAMSHPQSNVITRSLGDDMQRAKPDVVRHTVSKGEIILLCSDGLCGVCNDASIGEIIGRHVDNLRTCKEVLTNAALQAGGSDNITISLLQVLEVDALKKSSNPEDASLLNWLSWQNAAFMLFALAILGALCFAGIKSCDVSVLDTDSLKIDSTNAAVSTDSAKQKKDKPKDKLPKDTSNTSQKGSKKPMDFIKIEDKVEQPISNSPDNEEDPEKELTVSGSSGTGSPEQTNN